MTPSLRSVLLRRWRETRSRQGRLSTLSEIAADVWEFLRESTPERKRLRYGDAGFDWDYQVNTTAGSVTNFARLIAAISGAPYQPTDPEEFRAMLSAMNLDYADFTFIDLGSGKGRTLLMASEFRFRRILGVELVPELHEVARRNISAFQSPLQKCGSIESICCDARGFVFPDEPLLLYLFNPLPEPGLRSVIENLRESLRRVQRPVRILYLNPLSERVLAEAGFLRKLRGTHQYSVYSN